MEILASIASTIGSELAKYTLVPIGRRIGYLIFFNGNINSLADAMKKLNDKKTAIGLLVDAAERNLRIPAPEVKTWQQNVDVINGQAVNFLEEEIIGNKKCLNDLIPNPKSRYSLSRKASKMTQEILMVLGEAEKFSHIDLPAPLPTLGSAFNTEDTQEFESRNLIMNSILEALRGDSISMMSICGQGGVGKTTMVEKLVQIVESQKLFDKVAMAVVTQNPDVKTILGDIASCFGLKFHAENEQERAQKLHERIIDKGEKRILLILDDVWTEEDFKKLRIPAAGKREGYKILLTSRREDECQKVGSLMNFHVDALSNEEGWNLFKGIAFAGNSIENQDDLHEMAKQIADECDGLPIAIVTIAKALKGRNTRIWSDALNQLRSSNLKGISGMDKVFSRLVLSYNLLQREEAKSLFLLCCLFPEDYAILIEDLVRYMVGLRLLDNVETILQARDRVYALIGELKESFLLFDGNKYAEGYVKMHDVVRDVAISIASREKSYLVNCDKGMNHWPNKWLDRYHDCSAISLWCEEIKAHTTDLECPKLQLLHIQSSRSLPDNFFEGTEELKVVTLKGFFPPKSLSFCNKVQTLHLSHIESTSMIGNFNNVEILKIGISGNLQILPNEVGLMKNLRLLDMRDWFSLRYIPAGILSKLSKLEELYVSFYFLKWESILDGGRENASLKELESLSITTLEIGVSDISQLPNGHFFKNLVNFKISRIDEENSISQKSGNALSLTGDASQILRSGICALLKRVDHLEMDKVQNLKSDMYVLGDNGFPKLKTLGVSRCDEIEQLVDLKKIRVGCFRVLREVKINSCKKLEYVFPAIMTTRLSESLQSIDIYGCENMEGIFNGKEEGDDVDFHNLKEMYLSHLPNLKALWTNKSNDHQEVKSNSTEQLNSVLFPSSWIRTSNLKELTLIKCNSVSVLFSTSVAEQLLHLQSLEISDCERVEYVVGGHGRNTSETLLFPMLTKVSFSYLPQLASFCLHNHIFLDCSSLEDIHVCSCPKLQTIIGAIQSPPTSDQNQILFKIPSEFEESLKVKRLAVSKCANVKHLLTSAVAKLLVKLEELITTQNQNMEQVIAKENGEEEAKGITEIIEFSQLKSITLEDLGNLRCFYGGTYSVQFPSLQILHLKWCRSMKTFSYGSSLLAPKLGNVWLDDMSVDSNIDLNTMVRKEILSKLHFLYERQLQRISLHHLSHEEMGEIRQIKIRRCKKLLNAIPCNLIAKLQKVEMLDVSCCDSLEEIFEYDGVNIENGDVAISSHLQHINLENLKNLKHVFILIPKTVIVFQVLKTLSIDGCKSLKNIFSVSMVRGLLQLEQLIISCCDDLEEIVAEENEEEKAVTNKIVLLQLCSVHVFGASKLKCFYKGTCALELPSLRSLRLNGQRMENFSNGLVSTPQLKQVQINQKNYPHGGNLNEDLKNEKFEKVAIECTEDFVKTSFLATEDSCRIKDLSISNCHALLNAVPCNLIECVQKLVVERCDSVEKIFEYEIVNMEETCVSNLEEIRLIFLPKLKHIFNKIAGSIIIFPKLRKLNLFRCGNLKSIFSISWVGDFVQLEELKITYCDRVDRIVEEEEEEENITNKVIFPQLRCIDISYSVKGSFRLKCFYNGVRSLEFPLLESLSLHRCYNMTSFSSGLLSTPMLQQVQINEYCYPCTGDLNQHLKNKMLVKVDVEKDEHFTRICNIAEKGSSRIQDLSISDSDKLFNDIPYSVIQNLEKLHIRCCHLVEAIFELDRHTTFSSLEKLSLESLKNLKFIFNEIPEAFVGFQRLTILHVDSCERLQNVFPVSMVRSLPQLQHLEISYCSGMEQIIAEQDKLGQESVAEKIVLPQLKSIRVSSSDNLKCFYNGICDIEFPLLQSLSVQGCYHMKNFSNGSVSTPKLQNLQLDWESNLYSGNLNADFMKKRNFRQIGYNSVLYKDLVV